MEVKTKSSMILTVLLYQLSYEAIVDWEQTCYHITIRGVIIYIPCDLIQFRLLPLDFDSIMQSISTQQI